MPTYPPHQYKVREREATRAARRKAPQELGPESRTTIALPTLQEVLHRLSVGLKKLLTALRFHWHHLPVGQWQLDRLPWFKIALATLAFFILTRKNIQFSINMRSPLSGFSDDRRAEDNAEQMSLAQPIALMEPAARISKEQAEAYIHRFAKVARAEQAKYGIPASLKMAQALYESRAGQSVGTRNRHNHFGLPLAQRLFDSAWENWRAHSLMLARQYPELAERQASAAAWADALQQSEWAAKDPRYGQSLLKLIDEFNLQALDQ